MNLRGVLNTALFNEVCQEFMTGQWLSPDTPVSSTKN
jgi:hypothetical protein